MSSYVNDNNIVHTNNYETKLKQKNSNPKHTVGVSKSITMISTILYLIYKAKMLKVVKLKCLNQTFLAVCHHHHQPRSWQTAENV